MIPGIVGLSSVATVLIALCGCSLANRYFPPDEPSLSNSDAIDRALKLCSLSQGDNPFHLILSISPPLHGARNSVNMRAQIEIFWLNGVTYRTVIRSKEFSQVRIVNGAVVEEHDTGTFYPRWVENFVDAVLEPFPHAQVLRKIPGRVPVGKLTHACISSTDRMGATPDPVNLTRICFQDPDPKIASGLDFGRYVSFDDFAPFGSQMVARTLVNELPANTLVRGQIILLERLPQSAYPLLRTREFTPLARQIRTTRMPEISARPDQDISSIRSSLGLPERSSESNFSQARPKAEFGKDKHFIRMQPVTLDTHKPSSEMTQSASRATIYVRTDRSGQVREAYPDNLDLDGHEYGAVALALTLKFKPLIVNGVPQQMEAPLMLPVAPIRNP
jgi:hypothetical protein